MPKLIKIFLFVLVPLLLLLGGAYGLAKVGVIPVKKLVAKNRAARAMLHIIGLDSPKLPARQVAPNRSEPADPLDAQRKEIAAQKAAFEKQRTDWEAERQAKAKAAAPKAADRVPLADPKSITRLAAVYEQMSAEAANKIFSKLPDPEVIALLRQMDEKKVGLILTSVPPDRAARLTLALSGPAAVAQASTAP